VSLAALLAQFEALLVALLHYSKQLRLHRPTSICNAISNPFTDRIITVACIAFLAVGTACFASRVCIYYFGTVYDSVNCHVSVWFVTSMSRISTDSDNLLNVC